MTKMRLLRGLLLGVVLLFTLSATFPGSAGGPPEAKPLKIITTVPDLASITKAVGGDLVDVESIARGYQDPHYVEGKPSYIVKVSRADAIFMVGMQLEIGWVPLLIQGARNPGLKAVAMNTGIHVLQKPEGEVSRQFGDIHPEGNPHYTLDPRNGKIVANNIAQALKDILPADDAPTIDANLKTFTDELDRRIASWQQRLAPYKGLHFISYHQQFEYFADFASWVHEGYIEEKPGIPPSPRHIAQLEDEMKRDGIKLIVASNFIAPRIPQQIAKSTGAKYLELPASVDADKGLDDYFALFDGIIARVEKDVPKPQWKERSFDD